MVCVEALDSDTLIDGSGVVRNRQFNWAGSTGNLLVEHFNDDIEHDDTANSCNCKIS